MVSSSFPMCVSYRYRIIVGIEPAAGFCHFTELQNLVNLVRVSLVVRISADFLWYQSCTMFIHFGNFVRDVIKLSHYIVDQRWNDHTYLCMHVYINTAYITYTMGIYIYTYTYTSIIICAHTLDGFKIIMLLLDPLLSSAVIRVPKNSGGHLVVIVPIMTIYVCMCVHVHMTMYRCIATQKWFGRCVRCDGI